MQNLSHLSRLQFITELLDIVKDGIEGSMLSIALCIFGCLFLA